jgi:putative Holliday junction resolvase
MKDSGARTMQGRILGVDYGRKRIGLAVCDFDRVIASALEVIEGDPAFAVDRIGEVARDTGAVLVVVGLPLNMDGTAGPMAEEARAFAGRLAAAVPVPVELYDERLTTAEAERILLDADLSRAKRKAVRDRVAARILLQDYIDSMSLPGSARLDDEKEP